MTRLRIKTANFGQNSIRCIIIRYWGRSFWYAETLIGPVSKVNQLTAFGTEWAIWIIGGEFARLTTLRAWDKALFCIGYHGKLEIKSYR